MLGYFGYARLVRLDRLEMTSKKNGKKDDIVQKGGRGLGQIHHF